MQKHNYINNLLILNLQKKKTGLITAISRKESSIVDVQQGSKYASAQRTLNQSASSYAKKSMPSLAIEKKVLIKTKDLLDQGQL